MHAANLTRFGPATLDGQHNDQFRASEGAGVLRIRGAAGTTATVGINGSAQSITLDDAGRFESDIALSSDNRIEVDASREISVRVTQHVEADIGIVCQGYFGLNTTDIERQRDLYKTLGFTGEIYPAGPETSTSFARSLGFEDDYLIYVSLHSLENPPTMPFVDTVQFRGDSFRGEPPYSKLNHLGMTYATYATADLDGAYVFLKDASIEFVTEPTIAPNGERFVFMKEPDGAFLKLIATEEGDASEEGANLVRLENTNMNVADLERSREFYRLLGFTESKPGALAGDGAFAAAHGFDDPIDFLGEDISLGEGTDGATLQLRQWRQPFDPAPPYAPPVNHLGIDRINFYVKDLTHAVKTMNDLGFEQLGPIGGMPEVGIVFFFDPDGIKVQLAGPQTPPEA